MNSLYPSMMHSDSGNYYPVGKPHYWCGNFIHEDALKKTPQGEPRYFFLRIRTRFHVKHGYLPFIQIKGSPLYRGTEMLETSDVYSKKHDKYFSITMTAVITGMKLLWKWLLLVRTTI